MTSVAERASQVRDRIDAACRAAGREPAEVRLMAVTKTHGLDVLEQACAASLEARPTWVLPSLSSTIRAGTTASGSAGSVGTCSSAAREV